MTKRIFFSSLIFIISCYCKKADDIKLSEEELFLCGIMGYQEPQYPGGDSSLSVFFNEHFNIDSLPDSLLKKKRLTVKFSVDTIGITNVLEIIDSYSPLIDTELTRVFSILKPWTPGIVAGKKAVYVLRQPISFVLEE